MSGVPSGTTRSATDSPPKKRQCIHAAIKENPSSITNSTKDSKESTYVQGQDSHNNHDIEDVLKTSCTGTTKSNKITKNDKNMSSDDNTEEEEEQDIDVKPQTVTSTALHTGCILSNIARFLPIIDLIKSRGVNQLLNDEFAFGFVCNDFNLWFYYNNIYICNIIKKQYSDNSLQLFGLFYVQMMRMVNGRVSFGVLKREPANSKDKDETGLTKKYILTLVPLQTMKTDEGKDGEPAKSGEGKGTAESNEGADSLKIFEQTLQDNNYDLILTRFDDLLKLMKHYCYTPFKNELKNIVLAINENESDAKSNPPRKRKQTDGEKLVHAWEQVKDVEAVMLLLVFSTSIRGEFCLWNKFKLLIENGNVAAMNKLDIMIQDHIFQLFTLFLRGDMVHKYLDYIPTRDILKTLKYLIYPSEILKYKQDLENDNMFVLNDKNEEEFDLLNNPRYHPNQRIKYLKMLAKNQIFGNSLSDAMDDAKMRPLDHLLSSFTNFDEEWRLNKYQDLKVDDLKKRATYEVFKHFANMFFPCRYTPPCDPANFHVVGIVP